MAKAASQAYLFISPGNGKRASEATGIWGGFGPQMRLLIERHHWVEWAMYLDEESRPPTSVLSYFPYLPLERGQTDPMAEKDAQEEPGSWDGHP